MSGETILVVDDNPLNVKLTHAVLTRTGYTVFSASDASTAFAQLALVLPQLIILDLMLSEIDGLELARQLKHDVRYRDILIVAMTASGLTDDEERARLAGCECYLAKPFELEALVKTVSRCIR